MVQNETAALGLTVEKSGKHYYTTGHINVQVTVLSHIHYSFTAAVKFDIKTTLINGFHEPATRKI